MIVPTCVEIEVNTHEGTVVRRIEAGVTIRIVLKANEPLRRHQA